MRETYLGKLFFNQVARPEALRKVLAQAYAVSDPKEIDEETLNIILQPGLTEGAAEVFLDFISYR